MRQLQQAPQPPRRLSLAHAHNRTLPLHTHAAPAATHPQGPNLGGLFGRTSGQAAGFAYSKANKEKAVVWSENTLYDYLLNPKKYIPGEAAPFKARKQEAGCCLQTRQPVLAAGSAVAAAEQACGQLCLAAARPSL